MKSEPNEQIYKELEAVETYQLSFVDMYKQLS